MEQPRRKMEKKSALGALMPSIHRTKKMCIRDQSLLNKFPSIAFYIKDIYDSHRVVSLTVKANDYIEKENGRSRVRIGNGIFGMSSLLNKHVVFRAPQKTDSTKNQHW